MNKIFVAKNEDIASVVEKVLGARDDMLVLVIPKHSQLLGSLANFHLLKREADAVGKKILIESVDDQILAFAKASGIEAVNPFLSGPRRPVSDIISRSSNAIFSRIEHHHKKEVKIGKNRPQFASRLRSKTETFEKAPTLNEEPSFTLEESSNKKQSNVWPFLKKVLAVLILATFVAIGGGVALFWLPRADILIARKKHSWISSKVVVASKRIASISPDALQIPAQLFEGKRNITLSFPASDKKMIERKARGIVTLYNAYSSEPQSLVANTRLLTPEGKLFRLVNAVTVPGAKVVEGKIIPSSIEAEVIADKPGKEYNIGPVSRFTIPGFQGSPKYQGFYAASKTPMTGGFVGEISLPSAEDIAKGREESSRKLKNALFEFLSSQLPSGFKVPEGGVQFSVVKETIIEETSEQGKFSIFTEAQMKLLAFREDDLKLLGVTLARKEFGSEAEPVELSFSLGTVKADFDNGLMELPVSWRGIFSHHIEIDVFKKQIIGKSEDELRAFIAALPDFERAKVSLWPFWVKHVPSRLERINVMVE
jgi:hypothetical protein